METLRELRDRGVMTLEELAQACGVSKQMVWYWEKGYSMPRPVHIRKLAAVLGKDAMEMRAILEANLKEKGSRRPAA